MEGVAVIFSKALKYRNSLERPLKVYWNFVLFLRKSQEIPLAFLSAPTLTIVAAGAARPLSTCPGLGSWACPSTWEATEIGVCQTRYPEKCRLWVELVSQEERERDKSPRKTDLDFKPLKPLLSALWTFSDLGCTETVVSLIMLQQE